MAADHIRVRTGEPFSVALKEPVATGHRWALAEVPPGIVVIDETYEPPGQGSPVGGSGRKVTRLRATQAGRYELRFVLARPWEARPDREHRVEVDAVPDQEPAPADG
jgi:predicted secreted protein